MSKQYRQEPQWVGEKAAHTPTPLFSFGGSFLKVLGEGAALRSLVGPVDSGSSCWSTAIIGVSHAADVTLCFRVTKT